MNSNFRLQISLVWYTEILKKCYGHELFISLRFSALEERHHSDCLSIKCIKWDQNRFINTIYISNVYPYPLHKFGAYSTEYFNVSKQEENNINVVFSPWVSWLSVKFSVILLIYNSVLVWNALFDLSRELL